MKWIVLMLFLAALIADIYIYRSLIVLRFRPFFARVAYIVFAVFTDGAALTALMLYGFAADRGSVGVMTVMWLVWLFFLTFIPKLFYCVGGTLDFLIRVLFCLRRRATFFRLTGFVLALAVMTVMVCGVTAGRTRLRVEEVEICSERVPAAFDGYRIVQFSDIHVGTMLRSGKQIARLADAIASLGGDLVVNTGDLVNLTYNELTPQVMESLGRIAAPDGVWSVWGNHDLGFYIRKGARLTPKENFERLSDKVRSLGWRTLSDSSAWILRGADSILLTGIDYPTTRLNGHNNELGGADPDTAFRGVDGDPFSVVLSHTPKMWDEITGRGFGDLTLSGHVHAMQTKLKLFGKTWSPAQYMYDQWSGKYLSQGGQKNSMLYINDGIGCVGYPMRIGARGEITVITLKRCE